MASDPDDDLVLEGASASRSDFCTPTQKIHEKRQIGDKEKNAKGRFTFAFRNR